ncbi:hypothetical protein SpAn4DRAFT_5202 [Sporomusa ovata]|uniref:Uncharacterized protein n=1 Tax=Sporomusa ovata TaxID=2378 RepID=A0A0U1KX23_9FIRM|nr:hypothetical protein SpAn4DRAFT_5202 [Sporomusa ovata]
MWPHIISLLCLQGSACQESAPATAAKAMPQYLMIAFATFVGLIKKRNNRLLAKVRGYFLITFTLRLTVRLQPVGLAC